MSNMQIKVWSWRQVIQDSKLPSTTKLVLFNLSVYMNDRGQGCYPSTKLQAQNCSLSERAVCTHLDQAEKAGFIKVKAHGFAGQKWRANEYYATIPYSSEDVRGTEPSSARSWDEAAEPDDTKALNDVQSNSPIQHTNKKTKAKKSVEINLEDWEAVNGQLSLQMIANFIQENMLDEKKVQTELNYFRDKAKEKGYKKVDFVAAFRNWLRNDRYGRGLIFYRSNGAPLPPPPKPSSFNFASREATGNNL